MKLDRYEDLADLSVHRKLHTSIPLIMKYLIFLAIAGAILFAGCKDNTVSADDDIDLVPGTQLVHFFLFDGTIPNNRALETVAATFSASNGAIIYYTSALTGYPQTDRRASLERRNMPSELNYRPQGAGGAAYETIQPTMRGLQVKQPFIGENGQNTVYFHVPTVGFERVQLTMAVMDESAANALIFDYSVTETPAWISTGLLQAETRQDLDTGEYKLINLNMAGISAANDNPHLRIRLRFQVADGLLEDGNRVTFNNIALDGAAR